MSLTDVGIYFRDRPFASDIRVNNIHQTKRSHWFAYINENCFDSYGCSSSQKLSKFFIKRNGYCLFSGNKTQGLTKKRFFLCKLLFIYN